MYVNKKANLLFISFILTFFILLNYVIWFLSLGEYLNKLVLILFFLFFFVSSYITFKYNKNSTTIFIFIFMLLVVGILSPTTDWDARSIWLFHAKRIYFESSLFAQLDNYAPFSHNDYPTLIPSFIASLANLTNTWNELFPKVGATLTLIPAIIIITKFLKNQFLQISFFFILIEAGKSLLLNGYMDEILAIWLTASFLLWIFYLKLLIMGKNNLFILMLLSLSFCMLIMIKNEGVVMFLIILLLTIVTIIIKKKYNQLLKTLTLFVLPLLFIISWKMTCKYYNINNDLTETNLIDMFMLRIFDLSSVTLVLKFLFIKSYGWIISLLFYLLIIFNTSKKFTFEVILTLSFVILYVLIIFFIYLSTPHNLEWHLSTSATRVMLPILILIGTMSLLKFKNINYKNVLFFKKYDK